MSKGLLSDEEEEEVAGEEEEVAGDLVARAY